MEEVRCDNGVCQDRDQRSCYCNVFTTHQLLGGECAGFRRVTEMKCQKRSCAHWGMNHCHLYDDPSECGGSDIPVFKDLPDGRGKLFQGTKEYTTTQELIVEVCQDICSVLLEKNRKYGDSAINPKRIFSKADAIEQINVRLDDKLSRVKSSQDDDTEDTELDLIGYLVLKRVAKMVKEGY